MLLLKDGANIFEKPSDGLAIPICRPHAYGWQFPFKATCKPVRIEECFACVLVHKRSLCREGKYARGYGCEPKLPAAQIRHGGPVDCRSSSRTTSPCASMNSTSSASAIWSKSPGLPTS